MRVISFASYLFAFLLTNLVSATAQTSKLSENPTYFPREWAWTQEEWTGSDAPYLSIRKNVDNVVARNQDIDALTRRYAKSAAEKPADPKAQFAWGYAALIGRKPGTYVGRELPNAISKALASAPSPQSYQYTRMRYLMLLSWGTWRQLTDLGRRLLAKNPNDWPVKRHLARLLALGTPTERKQGLVYANQLVAKYPNRPSSYGVLGDVYLEFLHKEQNADAGYKAIAAYKRSLALNPTPLAKDDMEYLIGVINKRIARLKG